ncbi:MAG: carbamoyl phosphate synthase small subunit [Eubacteriales bacterium]
MNQPLQAQLILENGTIFHGTSFGYSGDTVGEIVFNTCMTGYQELLTDPSYAGQIVTMTYPLIGNYGINFEDMESKSPALKGFVVRECCDFPSNWRCETNLADYLQQQKIPGIEGVDTRALTRIIRENGTMRALITTQTDLTQAQIQAMLDDFSAKDVISECTIKEPYTIQGGGTHFAFLDFGAKDGILRELAKRGSQLSVFPAFATAEEILAVKPDALFLSNGPGDPKDIPEVIETIKSLIGTLPILGVCMGNQLLTLALGGNTRRMTFGHHGGNHPVRDLSTGRVYITSQNHEFVACDLPDCVEPAFININDGSIEGIIHKTLPIFSVQFHPEAAPGPLDSNFLFDRFIKVAKGGDIHA